MAAQTILIAGSKELAKEIGKSVIADLVKDQGTKGLKSLTQWSDKAQVASAFEARLMALDRGQGTLFGFSTFVDPSGEIYTYGPYLLGAGPRPAAPLVALGFSNAGVEQMGKEVLQGMSTPAGLQWKEMNYYWAFRTQDGKISVYAVDGPAIQSEAIATQLRVRLLAQQTATLPSMQKLAQQAKLFNEIEDRMREELRARGIEARLASLRHKMTIAENQFRLAIQQRDEALARAKSVATLQQASQLLGLVGNFSTLLNAAQAKADYNQVAAQSTAGQYNSSVKVYINVFKTETTLNHQTLPPQPEISVDPPL